MAQLRRFVFVRHNDVVAQRHASATEDIHFAEAVATAVLEDLTQPGDRVLDPFAGFGTTLRVAQRLGRPATGVELLADRCAAIRQDVPEAITVEGDARRLSSLVRGPFDLVVTSPPYMTEREHPEDPFTGYGPGDGDYSRYLRELTDVLRQSLALLRPGGHLVVNVANISADGHFTPLAWDIGRALAEIADLRQDTFVCWDHPLPELAGDYLLVATPRRTDQRA